MLSTFPLVEEYGAISYYLPGASYHMAVADLTGITVKSNRYTDLRISCSQMNLTAFV
jgi:hypothetical protein